MVARGSGASPFDAERASRLVAKGIVARTSTSRRLGTAYFRNPKDVFPDVGVQIAERDFLLYKSTEASESALTLLGG